MTQQEIDAEAALQLQAAYHNPFPPVIEPVRPNNKMRDRLRNVASRVNPEASRMCMELMGVNDESRCHFGLAIKGEYGVNAYADGQTVYISGPMMEFAYTDTYLALVVAHELAHNMMRHPDVMGTNMVIGTLLGATVDIAAGSQGADTQGSFSALGQDMTERSYSPGFEQEADYIALYILARANSPREEAPLFWRNFSRYDAHDIYARTTHPTNPARFVAMNKTIAEIRAKQKQHLPLLPNFRPVH